MGESDIVQKIIWYNKNDFEMDDPVCDFCSEPIDQYPCPVNGSYALCNQCRNKLGIKKGHTEYFETRAYNMDIEAKELGVNCRGR